MEGTCLFTPGAPGRCRGLILLPSQEGHSPFSSHDGHRVVLKSGKMQPINYSRGQRGQSLAWNWARSYQSAGASEGDICLWDSLTLFTSISACRFPSLLFGLFFSAPSVFPFVSFSHSVSVTEQSLHASIFRLHLPLQSPLSFFYIALPLDILFLSLCAAPTQALSSMDLPCLFSRILLHHPCFNMSLILLPSLLLSPPSLSRSLCLELLVVLRTLAPSPSAAICFGLSALQPAGQNKALMYFPSMWCQYHLNGNIWWQNAYFGGNENGPSGYSETNTNLIYKFKADVVQDCANYTFSPNRKLSSYKSFLKQVANSWNHTYILQREQVVLIWG